MNSPGAILVAVFALAIGPRPAAHPEGPAPPGPIRGMLVGERRVTPTRLGAWKGMGAIAVVVRLDESVTRARWAELAGAVAGQGMALYPWIEVARNPAMADAHPSWMATVGRHHNDWRTRFPAAPRPGPGEVIKAWPWVPIGYAPAFEAHRLRVKALLDGLPGEWAGVFLNDLQAGPSSCGCGNDQCRWALDYGTTPTAPKVPGDAAAAQFVAEVRGMHPGKVVVPVWVTECEPADSPSAGKTTGLCGGVECARNDCWPRYARAWNPLVESTPGPIAVGLWRDAFRRGPDWDMSALATFRNPPRGGRAIEPGRVVAVLQGRGVSDGPDPRIAAAGRDGGGWVVAHEPVDQSWEPRLFKADGDRPGALP